jgi:8-oxo-dGTP pyrophosphatase MutT (NUDIX family)
MSGRKPHQVAAAEAHEEAGITGVIGKKPIGSYPYAKELPGSEDRLCQVVVYPLRLTLEAANWREGAERRRQWFLKDEAAALVDEGGLAQIIDEWRQQRRCPIAAGPSESRAVAAAYRARWKRPKAAG